MLIVVEGITDENFLKLYLKTLGNINTEVFKIKNTGGNKNLRYYQRKSNQDHF